MAKRNETAVSNEEIIAALLQHGTIREAAEATGLSTRAIYDRMRKDRDFRGEYAEAKNSLMRRAVFSMSERLSAAIDTIAEIMTDTETNPAIRLQCAQTILNNASKFNAWLQQGESHARSESATDPLDVTLW